MAFVDQIIVIIKQYFISYLNMLIFKIYHQSRTLCFSHYKIYLFTILYFKIVENCNEINGTWNIGHVVNSSNHISYDNAKNIKFSPEYHFIMKVPAGSRNVIVKKYHIEIDSHGRETRTNR